LRKRNNSTGKEYKWSIKIRDIHRIKPKEAFLHEKKGKLYTYPQFINSLWIR